jgi:hypothetical protein
MSYTYATYQTALALEMGNQSTSDPNFIAILPTIVDYAEQRLYRELDLLSTTARDSSKTLTAGIRTLAMPANNYFITLQQANVLTPIGTTVGDNGMRNPLTPVTKEWLDLVYGSAGTLALPQYFAMLDNQTVVVGPWPDQGYNVEFVGTIRPVPLYTNTNGTFLSLYLPDLFLAASMVAASGYQKNFGAQSDDPRMAQSWEEQVEKLMTSAMSENLRSKFQGALWTSDAASPTASPVRGA